MKQYNMKLKYESYFFYIRYTVRISYMYIEVDNWKKNYIWNKLLRIINLNDGIVVINNNIYIIYIEERLCM